MCRMQCVLALATLYVGLVHSWDIAVSLGDQLQFYNDGTKTDTVHLKIHNITTITYDEVHNMILFIDKQSNYDAICGYKLSSKNVRCFVKRYGSNIHDLAFDPATDLLFFTDKKDKSINWISLKDPGSEDNVHGNLLINMVDRTPTNIEVDSCNGFIYWTNTERRHYGYYMERARLNGSERRVVERITPVNNFAFDLQTRKKFFFTGFKYDMLTKVDSRLNSRSAKKEKIYYSETRSCQELTVSKDYLYWTQSNESDKTIWQKLKNSTKLNLDNKVIYRFHTTHKLGIAANYRIKDQVHGLQDCEALARLIPILEIEQTTGLDWSTGGPDTSTSTPELDWSTESTETSSWRPEQDWSTGSTDTSTSRPELDWSTESTETSSSTTELDWSTGSTDTSSSRPELDWSTESIETSSWRPELDWSTESTETSSSGSTTELDLTWCTDTDPTEQTSELYETAETADTLKLGEAAGNNKNIFLDENGELDFTTEPDQTPKTEIHACHGYCLNNGNCSLNKKSEPICHCKGDYVGDKCEVSGCHNYCFQGSCSLNDKGHPKCRCNAGYSGARCEVYACQGFCLNSGDCSINKQEKPVCRCVGNHEGARCEAVKKNIFSYNPQIYSAKRNLTLADLISNWQKPAVKVSVVVEV